jgi:3-oxoacyl-[acyl-carrier protein] reductase
MKIYNMKIYNMKNLNGKTIILTGASKGIGKVTAKKLTEYESNLVLVSRKMSDLQKVEKELNYDSEKLLLVEADVSNADDDKKIIDETIKKFSRIDVLINNAAQFAHTRLIDIKIEDFDRVMNTNIRGVFILTKFALKHMIPQNSGAIVNISSTAGKRGYPTGCAYGTSKFALNGFSESLFKEVREYNIRVITISPSMVDTREKPLSEHKESGKGVYMRMEDVADTIIGSIVLPERCMIKDVEIWGTNP